MRALYSAGISVPWTRVARDHRTALVPLGIAFAVNLVVLLAVVLPLKRSVDSNQTRAEAAAREEATALTEYRNAEALRDGKTRAGTDLETFYKQVLPSDFPVARRMLQSKILKLADAHDVHYEGGSSDTEEIRDSTLERLTSEITVTGDYDDLRALLYEIETSPEFIVIDQVVLAEGQNQNAPLALTMELSTYYRVPVVRAKTDGR